VRDLTPPPGLLLPRQVHGAQVALAAGVAGSARPEADAVVSRLAGVPVGVVTADCVPVLAAAQDGGAVAAIHAGWRGLASGVIPAAIETLRRESGAGAQLVAVIGPHIGACCYEVDAPVLDALAPVFGAELDAALRPARPGHAWLDLGRLARAALLRAGLAAGSVALLPGACTRCDAIRFHSYRREGARAGRLHHFVAAARRDLTRGGEPT
jgi:YfiH family protein